MQQAFCEIETDYQQSVANRKKAWVEGNEYNERFYKLAFHNLFEELQRCSY
jgi:hypothetical protein